MENLIFALNSTIPVFLVILLGWFLRRLGILNSAFNACANAYVFQCALPVNLFLSMAEMDFYQDFDLRFFLFCLISTFVMFFGIWGASWRFLPNKAQVGAFAQASARSSAAILGVAFAQSIYGSVGMVPMMILAAVPWFNVLSVVILSFSPHMASTGEALPNPAGSAAIRGALKNVLKNPLIIGILLGVPFALLRLPIPTMLHQAMESVGGTASPVALLVVGASFSGSEAITRWKEAVVSSFLKLWLLPALFLPIAAALGLRDSAMVAVLIMTGSPTTVTCFIMAKNMKADHVLTSNAVLLSTLMSSVSICFWLYVLRSFGLV